MYEYTVTTQNATNRITATPTSGTATIKVNGEPHENGTAATWLQNQENYVEISVGNVEYRVTVTQGD